MVDGETVFEIPIDFHSFAGVRKYWCFKRGLWKKYIYRLSCTFYFSITNPCPSQPTLKVCPSSVPKSSSFPTSSDSHHEYFCNWHKGFWKSLYQAYGWTGNRAARLRWNNDSCESRRRRQCQKRDGSEVGSQTMWLFRLIFNQISPLWLTGPQDLNTNQQVTMNTF